MEETIMNIKNLHHPKSMLAIAVALAVQTAAANADNINLLAITPPTDITSDIIINNNDSLTLSSTENTGDNWNQVRAIMVGDAGVGTLMIDGRDIIVTDGASIGRSGTGTVTLTTAQPGKVITGISGLEQIMAPVR